MNKNLLILTALTSCSVLYYIEGYCHSSSNNGNQKTPQAKGKGQKSFNKNPIRGYEGGGGGWEGGGRSPRSISTSGSSSSTPSSSSSIYGLRGPSMTTTSTTSTSSTSSDPRNAVVSQALNTSLVMNNAVQNAPRLAQLAQQNETQKRQDYRTSNSALKAANDKLTQDHGKVFSMSIGKYMALINADQAAVNTAQTASNLAKANYYQSMTPEQQKTKGQKLYKSDPQDIPVANNNIGNRSDSSNSASSANNAATTGTTASTTQITYADAD